MDTRFLEPQAPRLGVMWLQGSTAFQTLLFGYSNFSSSAAGSITTLSGDPRVMQLALRLSF
jgi:hypothetical protein